MPKKVEQNPKRWHVDDIAIYAHFDGRYQTSEKIVRVVYVENDYELVRDKEKNLHLVSTNNLEMVNV